MNIGEAQENMRFSYFGGGVGVLVSGLVWCVAGVVAVFYTNQLSMKALFIGGMFIHPLAVLLTKALKRPGNHDTKNPLGILAGESTVILFVGLFIAFYVANLQVQWFYPIMLMTIGVRYLMFQTLFGNKLYWLLGLVLILEGVFCILQDVRFIMGAFIGGITEILFSFVILYNSKNINNT